MITILMLIIASRIMGVVWVESDYGWFFVLTVILDIAIIGRVANVARCSGGDK